MPEVNITIKANANSLDAELKKSLRDLGVHHDAYDRLVNKEGQFVGALSAAKIKMGYYIDTQGKLRDAQGHLVEGLTAAEKALRMYINAEGDVVSADGEFIRFSMEKTEALKKEADAAKETAKAHKEQQAAIQSALSGCAQLAGTIGAVSLALSKAGKEEDKFLEGVAKLAGSVGAAISFAQSVSKIVTQVKNLRAAMLALNSASGIFGILALTVGAMVYWYKKTHEVLERVTKEYQSQVREINALAVALEKFARAGVKASNAQVALAAASMSPMTVLKEQGKQLDALFKKREQAWQEYKRAHAEYEKARADGSHFNQRNKYYQERLANAIAANNQAAENHRGADADYRRVSEQFSQSLYSLIKSDLPSTQLKELREKISFYNTVIQKGGISGQILNTAQEALANVYAKYAAEFKIDSQSDLDEAIRKAAEDLGETSEAFKEVSNNLRNAFEKQKLDKSQSYIDSLREQMKTDYDRLQEETQKITEAYEQGVIDLGELNKMSDFLRDKYTKSEPAEQHAEEPEERRYEERYQAPKSLTYGSQSLYEVLTQRDNDQWRNNIQTTIQAIRDKGEDANDYLSDIKDGILSLGRDIGIAG